MSKQTLAQAEAAISMGADPSKVMAALRQAGRKRVARALFRGGVYIHALIAKEYDVNAGCDRCGIHDRVPGYKLCQHCLAEGRAE